MMLPSPAAPTIQPSMMYRFTLNAGEYITSAHMCGNALGVGNCYNSKSCNVLTGIQVRSQYIHSAAWSVHSAHPYFGSGWILLKQHFTLPRSLVQYVCLFWMQFTTNTRTFPSAGSMSPCSTDTSGGGTDSNNYYASGTSAPPGEKLQYILGSSGTVISYLCLAWNVLP